MASPPPSLRPIDTGYLRPRFAACYLLADGGEAALVDAGHGRAAPRILAALAEAGVAPEAVRYLVVTHVHLDHAGGAGALLKALPRATLVAHPRGAPHLVDPSRLLAGARAVYGAERLAALHGTIEPAPAERVRAAPEGTRLPLGRLELVVLDTPGHARHHLCLHVPALGVVLTGDSFGLSYPELRGPRGRLLFPSTSPVQFDPEALVASVGRLGGLGARQACLTHYGCLEGPAALAPGLQALVREHARLAREVAARQPPGPERVAALEERLRGLLLAELRRLGCPLPDEEALALMADDLRLNAEGLAVWLEREAKGKAEGEAKGEQGR
ncbi:MAG: MBL fold metallo-hydrolase [Gammaproteobacteria bacterium]|nr:MAG: MBL fold metallo-hydrolase [Gammaproteobacteria bacterium]